jgi:acetate kinase
MDTLVNEEHGCITDMSSIKACGHRIVHGGEGFTKSVIVDEDVLTGLEAVSGLAPLHNPANITGIKAA